MPLTRELRDEYERRFATAVVNPARKQDVEDIITRVMKNRGRYQRVEAATHVPWYIVAAIHNMECSGDFRCHLHNGDPLTARTKHVPKGRPLKGAPPFDWTVSAIDALQLDGFDVWGDWSLAGSLFKLESFNGGGYRAHGIPTPYLWSGSQLYTSGKFVRDSVFDPNAISTQIGAAVLLRRMVDQHLVALETPELTDQKCEGVDR